MALNVDVVLSKKEMMRMSTQYEIRKIGDVGTLNPVMARLSVQTSDLLQWAVLDKSKRDAVAGLYIHTLTWRLLRCHKSRDEILRLVNESIEGIKQQKDPRIKEVPHVIGLHGLVEQYLYEAKNYLRDVLQIFKIIYGCTLDDASAFVDMKGNGKGEFVKWAEATLGVGSSLAKMVMDDRGWITEVIRSRNAVEHPDGYSGILVITNIRAHPARPNAYVSPTWQRTGNPETDILKDMECGLDNLLTFGEDILVEVIRLNEHTKTIAFYSIPIEARDPQCPVRIRVDLSPEVLEKIPRRT